MDARNLLWGTSWPQTLKLTEIGPTQTPVYSDYSHTPLIPAEICILKDISLNESKKRRK